MVKPNGDIKLIDFGNGMTAGLYTYSQLQACTPDYACPEMHQEKSYKPFALDAWSAGQTLYAMRTGPHNVRLHRGKQILPGWRL